MSCGFKWLLFGSLCLVYSTMIIGVYLSSIHQSLSCSEWPLCPNGFLKAPEQNYIVEYMHRLSVGFTAGTIYATAVFARVKKKTAALNDADRCSCFNTNRYRCIDCNQHS